MSTSKATKALKHMGRDFWGRPYVTPMAAAMGTDGHTLKHWGRGKGPANLPDRLSRLASSLTVKYVGLAVRAVEWQLRLTPKGDIVTAALANRLRDIQRELMPPVPKPAAPEPDVVYMSEEYYHDRNLTVDELCEGAPPLVAAQLRDILEGIE